MNFEKLQYFAEHHFKKAKPVYVSPYQEFILHPDLAEWIDSEFKSDKRRRKSLILVGPSRLGKTEWARSLGPHMYFNHLANFKDDWNDEAEYIVFDDFSFDFIPNKKGFFGAQQEFQISGKYMRTRTVQWGKVCIYLTNDMPFIKPEERDWYEQNCTMIVLNKNNKFF